VVEWNIAGASDSCPNLYALSMIFLAILIPQESAEAAEKEELKMNV